MAQDREENSGGRLWTSVSPRKGHTHASDFGLSKREFAGFDGVGEAAGFVGAVAEWLVLGLATAAET